MVHRGPGDTAGDRRLSSHRRSTRDGMIDGTTKQFGPGGATNTVLRGLTPTEEGLTVDSATGFLRCARVPTLSYTPSLSGAS
jgi:hypothetical protein